MAAVLIFTVEIPDEVAAIDFSAATDEIRAAVIANSIPKSGDHFTPADFAKYLCSFHGVYEPNIIIIGKKAI